MENCRMKLALKLLHYLDEMLSKTFRAREPKSMELPDDCYYADRHEIIGTNCVDGTNPYHSRPPFL